MITPTPEAAKLRSRDLGVGHIAVQLAKWKGVFVTGTGSGRNAEFLTEIGVDQFIDYETDRFEDGLSNIDVVLDTLSGDVRERSWRVLKPGGVIVSIVGPPSAETAAKYGVRAANILVRPDGKQLTQITALVDKGKLKPNIDAVYPLAETAQAHMYVANGHTRGKVVLRMD